MANKITKKELSEVKEVSNNFNNTLYQLGHMRLVENELLIKAAQERSVVENVKKKLQDKYGNIDVDLKTGEYSESNKED
tara:strand:- start:1552 stop:1788 length:237 start_codon:yes stop_codon:yes gene_type:complete